MLLINSSFSRHFKNPDLFRIKLKNVFNLNKISYETLAGHRNNLCFGKYGDEQYQFPKEINSIKPIDQEVLAATMLGLGLWRLRPVIRPKIAAIAARIEGVIRQCCAEDGLDVVSPGGFEYWDSIDINGEKDAMDPFFATNSPNPKRGDPEYPRLQIENRTYKSRVFRKIHLELAVRQDGLQVFHFVMYPRFYYDLPILCMDIVSYNTGSMFAIADTSPVRLNNTLPEFYATGIKLLMKDFATLQSNQALPSWGRIILSHLCISIKPNNDAEVDMFINYACALARIHLEVSRLVDPVSPDRIKKVQEIIACHRRFCHNQTKNKKTFSILASSFGEDKAAKYIKNFMFECQA